MDKFISAIRSELNEKERNLFDDIVEIASYSEKKEDYHIFHFDLPELDLEEDEVFSISLIPDLTDYSKKYQKFPNSLVKLFKVSGPWSFGEVGSYSQITLESGENGTLHCLGKDIWKRKKTGFDYSNDICSPISMGMTAFVFVHPLSGELFLCDEVVKKIEEKTPVEMFLNELHNRLVL